MSELRPDKRPADGKPQRALGTKTLAAVAVAGLLIAFALANTDEVRIDYLVVSGDSPLILLIAISALLGFVAGALLVRRRRGREH